MHGTWSSCAKPKRDKLTILLSGDKPAPRRTDHEKQLPATAREAAPSAQPTRAISPFRCAPCDTNAGTRLIAAITCSGVISREHSNCRAVAACRGHHRKSLWSNISFGSFQQLLQACQLIT